MMLIVSPAWLLDVLNNPYLHAGHAFLGRGVPGHLASGFLAFQHLSVLQLPSLLQDFTFITRILSTLVRSICILMTLMLWAFLRTHVSNSYEIERITYGYGSFT